MEADRASHLLAAERARIEHALAESDRSSRGDDADAQVDQHLADQATDLYDKSIDQGNTEELRGQLLAVERAEQRLAEGSYGRSVESDEPIPDARLEAVPTAERTVEEQSRLERGN